MSIVYRRVICVRGHVDHVRLEERAVVPQSPCKWCQCPRLISADEHLNTLPEEREIVTGPQGELLP